MFRSEGAPAKEVCGRLKKATRVGKESARTTVPVLPRFGTPPQMTLARQTESYAFCRSTKHRNSGARAFLPNSSSLQTANIISVVDDTNPQLVIGLGDNLVEGSSVQQTEEEEFGELAFLLGKPNYCIKTPTDAAVTLFEEIVFGPNNIRVKLLQLAGELVGEYPNSSPLKKGDPKYPKANTTCGKLQAQAVADVDIEVRRFVLKQYHLYQ